MTTLSLQTSMQNQSTSQAIFAVGSIHALFLNQESLREILDAAEVGDRPGLASSDLECGPVPAAAAGPGAAVNGNAHRVAVHGERVRAPDEVDVLEFNSEDNVAGTTRASSPRVRLTESCTPVPGFPRVSG